MTDGAVEERSSTPLLTLGRVHLVRIQVGYRVSPEHPAFEQFLLDLPVADPASFDDRRVLASLEPVLYLDSDTPRHYSLHQHRWHTTWGASPGALEIGVLVTAGPAAAGSSYDGVTRAFRDLLDASARSQPPPTSRDTAILRARRGAATAYALDPDSLSLSAEQHDPDANTWLVDLRSATAGDEYDVLVGFVDGYDGSLRVRHRERIEVFDSVGSE